MTAPDVFLSYNREDSDTARRFAEGLEREGFAVWWDQTLRSGEAYDEVTEAALKAAKAVVVLWSPRSVVSRWVRAEATIADRNKTLVPVMIEPCERPIMFELTQTAELGHWTGEAGDKAWRAFVGDVQRFVGAESPAPVASFPPESAKPPPPKPGERGEAPSLAILPFANRSGLPEDEVFAIGMVEDVIDALSLNAAVNVLSSSATARFRSGAIPDLAAIGRELAVRYVLEGNVRRMGESLRMTTQLVEPESGRIVWTERFDRPLNELAAMQEELVVEVAGRLDASVNRLEIERLLKKPGDLTAWEAVTRALAAYTAYTPDALNYATGLSARAVSIDPNYGLAHAVLALTRSISYVFAVVIDANDVALIRDHAETAIKLDPNSALCLGYVSQTYSNIGEHRLALAYAERAVRKSPNASMPNAALGQALTLLNRTDEAVNAFDIACRYHIEIDLLQGLTGWKGIAFMRAGQWEDAECVEDSILSFDPTVNYALMHKAILCQRDGRTRDACAYVRNVREADPDIDYETWELRMSRWHVGSSTLDVILENLRAAWRAAEDAP